VEFDGPPSLYPVVGRGRQKVAKFDPVCSLAWRYIAWSSWHNVRDSARFSCRYLRLLVSKSVHTVQWSGVFGHAHSSGNMLRVAEVPLSRLWLLESRTFRNPALTSFAFAIVVTEGAALLCCGSARVTPAYLAYYRVRDNLSGTLRRK
jgi:hypothetical protein